MAKKIKDGVVGVEILNQYLEEKSDFNFELKVLNMMRKLNISCEHSGTYIDSATGIAREFDIRAHVFNDEHVHVRMAVECKNIKPNNPLLVMCVNRHRNESFHHVLYGYQNSRRHDHFLSQFYSGSPDIVRLKGKNSLYPYGEFTGKSISQVALSSANNEILASDSDVFSKWTQCVSSAVELIENSQWDHSNPDGDNFNSCSMVLPILVVPDNTLWHVKFDDDGNKISDPELTSHVAVYIDRWNSIGENTQHSKVIHYCLSHIDIFTMSGLESFISDNELYKEGAMKVINKELINESWLNELRERF